MKIDAEFCLFGFNGLIPCRINAPSTLQPAHEFHGRNVVVVKEDNGFRACLIDEDIPKTIHLPENTGFMQGWNKTNYKK